MDANKLRYNGVENILAPVRLSLQHTRHVFALSWNYKPETPPCSLQLDSSSAARWTYWSRFHTRTVDFSPVD